MLTTTLTVMVAGLAGKLEQRAAPWRADLRSAAGLGPRCAALVG